MRTYEELTKEADLVTEKCLSIMSEGKLGVFKDRMYSPLFMEIFHDLLQKENSKK